MIRKADQTHGLNWSIGIIVVLIIAIAAQQLVSSIHRRNLVERMKTAVDSMANSNGGIVPLAMGNLEDYPAELVVQEMQTRFAGSGGSRKLALAYGLSHFGAVNVDYLVAAIEFAPAVEVNNLATALGHSRNASLDALHQAAAACDAEENWHRKQRFAVVALYLGDGSLAREMCQLRSDRTQRLEFVLRWSAWHGDVARLAEFAARLDDAVLQSGLLAGLGIVRTEELTIAAKQAWHPILDDWFRHSRDAAVHGGVDWLMRQWNLSLPAVSPSQHPADGRAWMVNRSGLTMVKVPAGSFKRRYGKFSLNPAAATFLEAPLQTVELTRPFLMSDREVSVGQFQQMMNDPKYDSREKPDLWPGPDPIHSPTAEHPVQSVNWNDAVLFCNWLSRQEGLAPSYERTGHIWRIPAGQFDEWRLVPRAEGYRLPTAAEWEYACRAGSTTQDPLVDGVNTLFLSAYASGRSKFVSLYGASQKADVCGAKPPNGWGLFDLHGNVREWCHDWWEHFHPQHDGAETLRDPMGPLQNDGLLNREIRDGIFFRTNRVFSGSTDGLGFRVARSLEP